jgi:hypothetical protein
MTTSIHRSPRIVERVLGEGKDVYDAARARSAALAGVGHPGVAVPLRILAKDGGVVIAHVPQFEGTDIATLLAGRGSLRAGECVTLGTAVAHALAAMHAAGLAHGDISAANVMISDDRVVLVDTIAGAQPQELGTVPYSAPERAQGATPECDMYSLGVLLRECARGMDREVIEAWTEPLININPAARPAAAIVARALGSCAMPEPIEIPASDVAHAMRSRAQAHRTPTVRLPQGSPARIRRAVSRSLMVGAVAVVFVFATVAVVGRAIDAWEAPQQPHFAPSIPLPSYAALTPQEAGERLTRQRFVALAAADGPSLLATTTPTGPARAMVVAQAEALAAGNLNFEGLDARIGEVELLVAEGNQATVAVRYQVSTHRVVVAGKVHDVPTYEQAVVLDLTWREGWGWQVENARLRS